MPRLKNRTEAGRKLAEALSDYRGREDVMVLGLPRGGIPVACEIARQLQAPLDVFIVRKLGVPGQEELAMGAIASGGVRIMNEHIVRSVGIPQGEIDRIAAAEQRELERREAEYRGDRQLPALKGRTVILVDDGVATGASLKAAVRAVHAQEPKALVVAVGAAPRQTVKEFETREDVDDIRVALIPPVFSAVGGCYEDFRQTEDEDVIRCLQQAQGETGGET